MGHGPSSSHTMGPMRAAQMFLERNRGAVRFNVTLYGSLAATGKGHMTDAAILEVLQPVAKTNITWEPKTFLPFHPNGTLFESYNESGEELDTWTVYSIGGGTLAKCIRSRRYRLGVRRLAIPIGNMSSSTKALLSGIIWLRYGK